MKTTDFKFDKKAVSYEVLEDGYAIYLDGAIWISQHGEYGKPVDKNKSYEENCLAQIEEICNATEPQENNTEQRLSALEEENANLSATLDDLLTNVIPTLMTDTTEESEVK